MKKVFSYVKKFFHKLYLKVFGWWTFMLIARATKATYKLMPMLGKDPNYVPPPPPPPQPEVEIDERKSPWIVDTKERPTRLNANVSYEPWIKEPKDHPVLLSRKQWEEKKENGTEAGVDPEETSVIATGETLDSLRTMIYNLKAAAQSGDK